MSNKLFLGSALIQIFVLCWYADDIYHAVSKTHLFLDLQNLYILSTKKRLIHDGTHYVYGKLVELLSCLTYIACYFITKITKYYLFLHTHIEMKEIHTLNY